MLNMKYVNMYLGIEIECILNRNIHNNIRIGTYNNPIKLNKFFEVSKDGSINIHYSNFSNPTDAEFISCICKTKTKFKKMIKNFIEILSKNKEFKLNEVININSSCGLHLHLSLNNNEIFQDKFSYEILEEARNLFFKKLEENKILSDDTKQKIKSNYYRTYSPKTNKRDWENINYIQKLAEFNKRSECQNKGLEWRSFNLNGVKNWGEFEEGLLLGYEIAYFLFKKRTKGYKLKNKSINLNKRILKKLLKDNENKNKQINLGENA